MIVAANNKCNITELVTPYTEFLLWGIEPIVNTKAILGNYIGYLNCSTVNHVNCSPAPCVERTVEYICALTAGALVATADLTLGTVQIKIHDVVDNSKEVITNT